MTQLHCIRIAYDMAIFVPKRDVKLQPTVLSVLTSFPPQLLPTLPPPLFTPNSITVILSTTTYLRFRLPASRRLLTFSPVLSSKLLNSVTSLLSYGLFTGSK